jgi:tRNA(Ile)-lysidine synthase
LKINRQERDRVPLLCDGSRIVWILGYQIDNHYRVTQDTKVFLKIEFEVLQG